MTEQLFSSDFEVFGKVQGVFFRKYTKNRAVELNLLGWCMNTAAGTVKGQIQGSVRQIQEMQHWLQNVGSPSSKVERAVFTAPEKIDSPSFTSFKILH
ncbi:acylphosphatase-2-like [Bradysia coprophila]|uniref:acylphosphatase-2-like n=1 Tax=Bradysia coprophila TaxID=38358 RepID=UPI00187DCFE5|nr:acylphosphatase-2-like [Bradysia coprophila]